MYRPASPLVSDLPSWTFDSLRRFDQRTRSWLIWVSPPPASALILTDLAPAVLPRAAALLHPFECHRHPSLSFRRPSGYDRIPPPGLIFSSSRSRANCSARPLSWGFAPFSGHERKGSGFFPGTPTSPAVASSGFEPSRRLDPLHAFPNISARGRSWDCSLQGISPPAGPELVSEHRALLALPDLKRER